jgi:hypothetical protein
VKRLLVCVGVSVPLLVVGASCGSRNSEASTTPVPAKFSSLPAFPNAEPAGRLTTDGTTSTRSYQVHGTTPANVLAFYQKRLVGWTVSQKARPLGSSSQVALRATWNRGSHLLTVSSETAVGLGPGDVQYSLQLSVP